MVGAKETYSVRRACGRPYLAMRPMSCKRVVALKPRNMAMARWQLSFRRPASSLELSSMPPAAATLIHGCKPTTPTSDPANPPPLPPSGLVCKLSTPRRAPRPSKYSLRGTNAAHAKMRHGREGQ